MALSQFIRENMNAILDEWQQFAASIPAASALDRQALRDHAQEMLAAITLDMDSPQSAEDQFAKSKGHQARTAGSHDTAAESHAAARFSEGFDLKEMVSEYRALRASVIRLWVACAEGSDKAGLYELTRFNEGIDQALTESIARFADRLNEARELYMGALGHDLRTPLHVILQASSYLRKREAWPGQHGEMIAHIENRAQHIVAMVNDLLDVTRTRFGGALPLAPQAVNAGAVGRTVIEQFKALHPDRDIRLQVEGDLNGRWDPGRLDQLLSNLLRNALQHGDPTSTVTMRALSESDRVLFMVHNVGEPIPAALLPHIFEPLKRGGLQQEGRDNLGLGLYIACAIARAHHGTIEAASSRERGTLFTVALPRSIE